MRRPGLDDADDKGPAVVAIVADASGESRYSAHGPRETGPRGRRPRYLDDPREIGTACGLQPRHLLDDADRLAIQEGPVEEQPVGQQVADGIGR